MGYKERNVVYNINGENYNIQDIPGSTHPSSKGNGFQGTYPLGGTKRKYFSGKTESQVDVDRINFHLAHTEATIGSNALAVAKPIVENMEKPAPIVAIIPAGLRLSAQCNIRAKARGNTGVKV